CKALRGSAALQAVAQRSQIEDRQIRVHELDLVPNARDRVGSSVSPRHNRDAVGRGPSKITMGQRQIDYGLAVPEAVPPVVPNPDSFLGLLGCIYAPPDRSPVSKKPLRRAFIEQGGQGIRSVCRPSPVQLAELSAGEQRLAQRGKVALAYRFLDRRYLNP